MLPPGKYPLPVIRREKDPVRKVTDSATLLEYLLTSIQPELKRNDGKPLMLGDRVQSYEHLFTDVRDVNFALGVRNFLVHADADRGHPSMPQEIERAADHLLRAIDDVLPYVPPDIARDSRSDPEGGAYIRPQDVPKHDSASASESTGGAPVQGSHDQPRPRLSFLWITIPVAIVTLLFIGYHSGRIEILEKFSSDPAQPPPLPYFKKSVDRVVGVSFGKWYLDEPTSLYRSPKKDAEITATLNAGETVDAINMDIQTNRYGEVVVIRDIDLNQSSVGGEVWTLKRGDRLYIMEYLGEGWAKVWFQGKEHNIYWLTGKEEVLDDSLREWGHRIVELDENRWVKVNVPELSMKGWILNPDARCMSLWDGC